MDFFTVPTLTFGVLHCFFVIAHDRRQILHWEVTRHPTSAWVAQQLREAFPYDTAPRYLIFDRAANFNGEVIEAIKTLGIEPKRTSFRSPWQNGVAERWVGNCRRDLLDHVIVLNQRHLKRLMKEYVGYYHDDRTHSGVVQRNARWSRRREKSTSRSERGVDAKARRLASSLQSRRLACHRIICSQNKR